MKKQQILIPLFAGLLLIQSCTKDKETNGLVQITEEKHQKEEALETVQNELSSIEDAKTRIYSELQDLRSKRHNEESSSIREFTSITNKKLDEELLLIEKTKQEELAIANKKMQDSKELIPLSGRIDKKDEFEAVITKYRKPVYKKFEENKTSSLTEAKALVLNYKVKIADEMNKKYSMIPDKEKELKSLEKTIEMKRDNLSEQRKELMSLKKKISRLQELKKAKE